MSIKIVGSQAKVHWLSNTHDNGKLTKDHGVLYVAPKGLGQVTAESYEGLTPGEAFERRYAGQKSSMMEDFIANDLLVFDKVHGSSYDYDDKIRGLIHDLFKKKRITFDANYGTVQTDNTNSEALLDYTDADIESLISVVKQYLGLSISYDTKDPVVWRYHQPEDITETVDVLLKHKIALLAAYTSRGKTKMGVEIATRICQSGGIVLVTTPITDTKKGFEDNIKDFHFGNDRTLKTTYMDSKEFVKNNVADLVDRSKNNELIFIVLTVQDLRYNETDDTVVDTDVEALRSKYANLSGVVNLWIRDERHAQYNGQVTSKRLATMKADYELDLTATPYNVLDQYSLDQIISRTLIWGLKHRPHTQLPDIGIDCINTPITNVSDKLAEMYNTEEGYDPRKMFARDGDNFVLEAELIKLVDLMYVSTLSKKKNSLSIVNDTGLSAVAKQCGLWVLPNGTSDDSAGDYVPALADLLNKHYATRGIYFMDSYTIERTCPRNISIGDYIESKVKTHGRVVILTCGKFLTGTDIPVMGHIVLLDKMSSTANFEQLMGRMIRLYPGKDRVKMYCMAPGNDIKIVLGQLAQANAKLGHGTEYELLDCIPLSEYDSNNSCVSVTPTDILDAVSNWCRDTLRTRLPSNSLLHLVQQLDTSLWDDINTRQYRRGAPKNSLTDDTGSQVRTKTSSNGPASPITKTQLTKYQEICETIQAVMLEAQWVSYVTKNYDYRTLLHDPMLADMFENNETAAILDLALQSADIRTVLTNYLDSRRLAYSQLSLEEVHDVLFVNNDIKRDIGLVYLSRAMSKIMVDSLPNNKYNTIVVLNALSGILPMALRKRYPKAKIICAEYFPYFTAHLESLGFVVVPYTELDASMKIDAVVGNPPFQATNEDGERKDQASNLWSKFWGKSFEVVTATGTVALITPTTWLSPSADFKNSKEFIEGHDRLWNVFEKYSSYADVVTVADHFPGVGSSFGYVVVDKSSSTGLKFSDGTTTRLGFRPRGNTAEVERQLATEDNLGTNYTINQSNNDTLRVSLPMTRTLVPESIEILTGNSNPTAGSDKDGLYLYVYVDTLDQATHVQQRVRECLHILNVDCKWSGFVNIKAVKMIRMTPL
jgi:hypothetical protein